MPVITRQATTSVQDYAHARMVLRSAYRQVFGNAHLMDEELVSTAESLFLQGDLAVQGLVAALACSDTYRRLFLDKNGPYRFVELNFKHLLGRAPRDQAEVSEHVQRLANEGYEAEIASYVYSPEYIGAFGFDTVPYWRTTHTQTGESNLTYTRSLKLKGEKLPLTVAPLPSFRSVLPQVTPLPLPFAAAEAAARTGMTDAFGSTGLPPRLADSTAGLCRSPLFRLAVSLQRCKACSDVEVPLYLLQMIK